MIECNLFSPQIPEPGLEFHMMGFRDPYMHCWLDLQIDFFIYIRIYLNLLQILHGNVTALFLSKVYSGSPMQEGCIPLHEPSASQSLLEEPTSRNGGLQ